MCVFSPSSRFLFETSISPNYSWFVSGYYQDAYVRLIFIQNYQIGQGLGFNMVYYYNKVSV